MKRLAITTLVYLALALPTQAASVTLLTPTPRPGDAFIAAFDEQPTSVRLGNETLTPFPYRTGWRVVTPIPLWEKLSTKSLVTVFPGATVTKTVSLTPRTQLVINLPVPEKMQQTPAQLVNNLATTNATVGKAVEAVAQVTRFSSAFALPLARNNKISSPFGEVRVTSAMDSAGSPQVERITHLGVDFDQPKGSAVAAINDGVVAKSYIDPVYGNSVFVDHGRGIFTLYLHLNERRVKVGDAVKKGTIVGTLGESGLASAPHLHLSIKINGTSVDPLQFVRSFR